MDFDKEDVIGGTKFNLYSISHDDLSKPIKDSIRVNSTSMIKIDYGFSFIISNKDEAYLLSEKLFSFMHSQTRKQNLYMSPGLHEKEDIEAIYKIQDGRCYYTGKKLSNSPLNYDIDHIVPLTSGGSSWPENLALSISGINRMKHDKTKVQFFKILEKEYGKEWRLKQRDYCKLVDNQRKTLDKARKQCVANHLKQFEMRLKNDFRNINVSYMLFEEEVNLEINGVSICFPGGLMRRKSLFNSYDYIYNIASSIIVDK